MLDQATRYVDKVQKGIIADATCKFCQREDLVHRFVIHDELLTQPETGDYLPFEFDNYACRDCAELHLNIKW